MRVVLNAASANMGGAATYLFNLLKWFPILAPDDEFIVIVPAHTRAKLANAPRANVELVSYPHKGTGGLQRMYFDQVELPRLLRERSADVLFSTTGFGTWSSPVPQILLVRNMAYFDPLYHKVHRKLGRSLRKNTIRRYLSILSMKRSDAVLFPTNAMKQTVEIDTDLSGRYTSAIHYGCDHEAMAASGENSPVWLDRIRDFKKDGQQIILNVSTFSTQKNLETLVEAIPYLAEAGLQATLFTTTSREQTSDIAEYDALRDRSRELGVDSHWHELGYVPYSELGLLYEAADLFVFPSFTESFGHPMVEAMAFGLPVIASDTAVNREICGDAGIYFDTFNSEQCADLIGRVLGNESELSRLGDAAIRRSRTFSWRAYTEKLLLIFQDQHVRS